MTAFTVFLIALVLAYLYHGLGITVGYHRLLSHRALRVPTWLEYFIVSGGYLGLEGSPISWVATHRQHHKYTDQEGDPHKPADGFWHSFAGWLTAPKVVIPGPDVEMICPDLMRDPVYRFLDFNHGKLHALVCLASCILMRVVIFAFFGPWAVLGNVLGTLTVFIGPFWVNSVCHIPANGYQNFRTDDLSRNVPWVGYWALGEGWHNNHHAAPQSARHGIKPNEFDLSWAYISLLKALGIATNVRLPKEPKQFPAIEPEFAQLLLTMNAQNSDSEGVPTDIAQPVFPARPLQDELASQLESVLGLASEVTASCDQLTTQLAEVKQQLSSQLAGARGQLSGQLLTAREQLVEKLITNCDQLAEQMEVAKADVTEQLRSACEQLSDKMPRVAEAETV